MYYDHIYKSKNQSAFYDHIWCYVLVYQYKGVEISLGQA